MCYNFGPLEAYFITRARQRSDKKVHLTTRSLPDLFKAEKQRRKHLFIHCEETLKAFSVAHLLKHLTGWRNLRPLEKEKEKEVEFMIQTSWL